jgi:hypothetical protein
MKANNLAYLKIEASAESKCFFEKVERVAKEQEVRSSVNLLKRFIGFEGEIKPDKDKAKRLLTSMANAFKNKIKKNDLYYKELKQAEGSLKAYTSGKTDTIKMATQSLNGLKGICGLGKLKADTKSLNGTAETKESIAFNKAILKAKRGLLKPNSNIRVGKSKGVLGKHIGEHTIYINADAINKSQHKNRDHNLLWHNFINLPEINK